MDLCAAYAGRDESADLPALARLFAKSVHAPMVVDSTRPECIEAALKVHPGRCLVNSVNLEDGGKNLERVCRAARKYGAAVIALTIHEKGMAMTVEEKLATAKRIHDLAVGKYGLRPSDLVFDLLTFTVGSGDASLSDAAANTLAALRRVKKELPGVFTSLGVSNVSFGLSPASRKVLNSVFLHEAVAAGLDMAIIDAGKILPMSKIPEADREICLDLLHNRPRSDGESPLSAFIRHFADAPAAGEGTAAGKERPALPPEEELAGKVLAGDRGGAGRPPGDPAVPPPGDVDHQPAPGPRDAPRGRAVRPRGDAPPLRAPVRGGDEARRGPAGPLPRDDPEREEGRKVLLATVAGDVHDIGKNLVDIILSNNGYRVINLGIKVPAETIIEKAVEHRRRRDRAVGAAGQVRAGDEGEPAAVRRGGPHGPRPAGRRRADGDVRRAGVRPRVPRPGGVLPRRLRGPLRAAGIRGGDARLHDRRRLRRPRRRRPRARRGRPSRGTSPSPEPPFLGRRHVAGIDPALLFPYVNEQALFRGRWGYRRGKMTAEDYSKLVREQVRPMYEEMKARAVGERLLAPAVAYGWFRCFSEGDTLVVEHEGRSFPFPFPRQGAPPHLCIADYFRRREDGGDVAGFFVATVGDRIGPAARELFGADRYHDYLMLHAFGVEVADALAEYWHETMRRELGIAGERPLSPVRVHRPGVPRVAGTASATRPARTSRRTCRCSSCSPRRRSASP